jgi:1-acyl-sn-glycerol-3-phosphate acyltransferase
MTITTRIVNTAVKTCTHVVCRVDSNQLVQVPQKGPLILVTNHIASLEVPLVYVHLQPRPVTGFVKAETWENPFMGYLFDLWGGIPLRRGEADVEAIRQALDALEAGNILALAPEGTRSFNGRLQRGRPGTALMSLRSGAPVMPLVYFGVEKVNENLKRLRRTDFNIVVGRPFYVHNAGLKVTSQVRQQITDEIMFQIAALLPPPYRGVYSNLSSATENFLRFVPPSHSNLPGS